MLTINLPFPVSVNAMYSNAGKRRIKSKRYKAWRQEALKVVGGARLNSLIDYPIMLQIALTPPDKRKRDLSNLEKCIGDILTDNIIVDDSQIKLLCMWWDDEPSKVNAGARVMIDPLHSPAVQELVSSLEDVK